LIIVRRLTSGDRDQYRALAIRGYTDHPEAFTSSAAERSALPLSWWEKRLAPNGSSEIIFGAFKSASGDDLVPDHQASKTQLVGVAGLSLELREKTQHKATLIGMYISPEARGQKVGQQLVNAVLDHAKQMTTMRIVQLTVTVGNLSAQTLYEQCGFETFGIEPFAVLWQGQFYSKRHMTIDLGIR
jgi:RimJ/RimL family protein N-acetyltransferase